MHGFRFCFTPLTGVLFTFRSRYCFTIGHRVVLSLAGWAPLIHARFHGTGATREICRRPLDFAYEAITLYDPAFQPVRLSNDFMTPSRVRNHARSSHNPRNATLAGLHITGLG